MNSIEVRSLNKYYTTGKNSFHALKDIDMQVKKGEFVVILGQSGSGKSTLMNILGGLDDYDSGEVKVFGTDYKSANDKTMSRFRCSTIGFVFQAYNLIPVLNVYENIVFPVNISRGSVDAGYIDSIMEKLGILDKKDSFPSMLSGGQQQRVAIARALANKPELILADEPTGNLDTETGNEVLRLLLDSIHTYGQTLVMITHNPKIADYADRVIYLESGSIVPPDGTES
ncbi:MAG: ABC transporter ATP-binding protein [Ruminococcus sp.]|nr:ABC transporter ATP-binding protein [Ruminococcus sp.]